jgi:predicted ATPase
VFPDVQLAPSAEPEQEKRDLLRAWLSWLAGAQASDSTRTPTLMIVEDLHWCDDLTLELLLLLARETAVQPLVVVLTYRSGKTTPQLDRLVAQLVRERLAHELMLAPLPPDAVEVMMRA